jgi:hypothetical protein
MSDDYIVLIPIMYDVVLDELNCYEVNASHPQVITLICSVVVCPSYLFNTSRHGTYLPSSSTSTSIGEMT